MHRFAQQHHHRLFTSRNLLCLRKFVLPLLIGTGDGAMPVSLKAIAPP
ncbi:hypothetical protein H6G89_04900 [Oscillatoria sp. FACHB-1407]|nr:hypothetical protein [Oscillatoria sp. FACHB-1407]MBD2460376.1 hypothetical protein [Oscillatoria sp. FACHB-1407]